MANAGGEASLSLSSVHWRGGVVVVAWSTLEVGVEWWWLCGQC